jgi:N-acetylglucosamine-6-phosphate deacetylase
MNQYEFQDNPWSQQKNITSTSEPIVKAGTHSSKQKNGQCVIPGIKDCHLNGYQKYNFSLVVPGFLAGPGKFAWCFL